MAADASIYGLMRQPQQTQGPLQMAGQAMQLKALMGQGQLQDFQFAEAQKEAGRKQQLRDLFAKGGATPEQVMAVDPATGMQLQKFGLEKKKLEAGIAKDETDIFGNKMRQARDIIAQARGDQDMPFVREQIGALLGQQFAQRIPDRFDPQWQKSQIVGAEDVIKNAEAQLGRDVTIRGQDVAARTARRGQDLTNERALETTAAGKVPPGYRRLTDGSMEAIPGGPADQKTQKKTAEMDRTLAMYVAARDGLLSGLEGSETGPVFGRIPAVTTGQQVAEGGVAAMAPVLKQLFRVAGEGVFTDRDQALLIDMVPKRTDSPEARAEKMANIDSIVSAKLGAPVPERASKRSSGRIKFLGFDK